MAVAAGVQRLVVAAMGMVDVAVRSAGAQRIALPSHWVSDHLAQDHELAALTEVSSMMLVDDWPLML